MSTITELPSEGRLNNVKEKLRGIKELIVRAESSVDGDQYPIVGGGVLTAAFGFVWYWDPSFITFIAFIGFLLTIADYTGPNVMRYVFNTADWNEMKEKKFDVVCEEIVKYGNNLEYAINSFMEYRSRKPILHFLLTIGSLCFFAWIGNRINNFFLAYMSTIAMVLLPKVQRQGVCQKLLDMLKVQLERAWVIIEFQLETLTKKIGDVAKEKYTMIKSE